jgi:hypothetical protein
LESIDDLKFLSEAGRKTLRNLAPAFALGDVVLFAGAGLSFNALRNDGKPNRMPSWKDLAAKLRDDLGSGIAADADPLRVADYYEVRFKRNALIEKVSRAIADDEYSPGRVHECVAELNLRDIITTNYDTLIERAFETYRFQPQVIVRGSDFTSTRRSPRILKMNGCILRNASDIVITGDDFLAYPSREPLIEAFMIRSFVESRVLFAGFSLNDPTFRLINEKVLRVLGKQCPMSVALVFGVDPTEIEYWKTRFVDLVDLRAVRSEPELTAEETMYRVLHALVLTQRRWWSLPPDGAGTAGKTDRLQEPIVVAQAALAGGDVELLEAVSRLTLDCLATPEMPARARYLELALLFGPLDDLERLVGIWMMSRDERELLPSFKGHLEPTHAEYRLPILGFFGLLDDSPTALQRAADSLWTRHLAVVTDSGQPPVDSAARYRHILRFSEHEQHEWPGIWIHQRRMSRVAGSFLEECDATRDAVEALTRGWLFERDAMLPSIRQSWSAVSSQSRQGRFTRPWLPLLAATVAFEGDRVVSAYGDALSDAWHQGGLDPLLLLRYIAHRIGNARFPKLERRTTDKSRVRPVQYAEDGMAALTAWTIDRIDEEITAGTLREEASGTVLPVIERWLMATRSTVVRQHLLHTLAVIDGWDHLRAQPIIADWIDSQAQGELKTPIDVSALDRTGELAAKNERVRLMVVRAGASKLRGSDVRADIEKWVIRWADSGVIDARLLTDFASELLQWILAEGATFEWIARAARIRASARLTAEITALDPVAAIGSLGSYVMERLQSLPSDVARLWPEKRSAFFEHLAAFVPDLDTNQRAFLAGMVDPLELTPDGREGAVVLAVRMLQSGGGDTADWEARLQQLVNLGATGRGALAGHLDSRAAAFQRKVESNLIETLARGINTGNTAPVTWIASTLLETRDSILHELEYALCALLLERNRAFAVKAAEALQQLASARPDVIERNRLALERVKRIVETDDRACAFRSTARFMSILHSLSSAEEENQAP